MKTFTFNAQDVILDPIRSIFVLPTPEEKVRQRVLQRLLNEDRIPANRIKVEEAMTHYRAETKGRADIVVEHPDGQPWILFEIKSPSVSLVDDTLNQASRYNEILGCSYIFLSNGDDEKWYEAAGRAHRQIERTSIAALRRGKVSYLPISYEGGSEHEIIGEDTPAQFHELINNLDLLFINNDIYINQKLESTKFTILKDGIRNTTFGNAGGGSYDGLYRYFVLEFPNGENRIVSIGLFATAKMVNDPHWGTRNSYTSLIVAIDDLEGKHNSLQLNVERNASKEGDWWIIRHEGKITVGSLGAASPADVIAFVREKAPDLVENNAILLGKIPANEVFTWENTQNFILNLIRYALIRDEFRAERKAQR